MSIGFGIVGCGGIAPVHAEALNHIPEARLVAVCSGRPERAQRLAELFGCEWTRSYEALLALDDVQAIDICTPCGLDAEMGIAAARAAKHVVVEKPLAVTTGDADRPIAPCDAARVILACIFNYRFTEAAQQLKKAMERNSLGRVLMASVDLKWFRADSYYKGSGWRGTWAIDGGVLPNQGSHHLDLLLWFLGDAEEVFFARVGTLGHCIEAPNTASAMILFRKGAVATVQATTAAYPGLPVRLELCGDHGVGVMIGDRLQLLRTLDGIDNLDDVGGRDSASAAGILGTLSYRWHEAQLRDFVAALLEGRRPLVDGREARKAVALVEDIYRKAGVFGL